MQEYRNELKFVCKRSELFEIEQRICNILRQDEHQIGDTYCIRSLYFDGYGDECVNENLAGVDRREKYRIRVYNSGDSIIKAEIKSHDGRKVKKKSARISVEQYDKLVSSVGVMALLGENECLDRYVEKISTRMYRPRVIVEYDRTAYVYGPCNVRITFDRNIRTTNKTECFFDNNIDMLSVLDEDEDILEVKYDEFLPDFIGTLLQGSGLRLTSFSKYAMSRMRLDDFSWEEVK